MNPSEVPQLLAEIALADPRVRRDDAIERRAQIHMWAGILAAVPYDFAVTAAQQHYAKSNWPILPADIATRWQATVRDRMDRHTGTFEPTAHPHVDPDDIPGYQQALRAERHAVATGHAEPVELRELTAGPAAADVQARLDRIGRYVPDHVRDSLTAYRPVRAERELAAREGRPDPLDVACAWCRAPEGQPCRDTRTNPKGGPVRTRTRRTAHPSRVDAATAAANARNAA
ncbi:zinc finger domain-containing protein [Streptomyces hebeiensis]